MDESERLVEAYIESDLQDEDCNALCQWLQVDRANRARFVRICFLHWQLFAVGRRKSVQAGITEQPRQAMLPELSAALGGSRPHGSAVVGRIRSRFRPMALTVAATVVLVCGLGAWTAIRMWPAKTVGQLTQATSDAAWGASAAVPTAGTFLHAGQILQLQRGRVLATLSSGVQVVMQGPATLRIDEGNLLYLQTGRITISVPRQASGFIVESPVARFVDLGTDFTVFMQPESGCELHVFAGLVEMTPHDSRGADELRVPEGRAILYRSASGAVTTLPYRVDEKLSM